MYLHKAAVALGVTLFCSRKKPVSGCGLCEMSSGHPFTTPLKHLTMLAARKHFLFHSLTWILFLFLVSKKFHNVSTTN